MRAGRNLAQADRGPSSWAPRAPPCAGGTASGMWPKSSACPVSTLGVAQRDHRAAPVVEQRLAVTIGRADPQRHEPRRRPVGPAPVLPQPHDLGAGAQRLAHEHRALEHQAAVEEVSAHALRRPRGLPDREVADEVGMRQQPLVPGHRPAELRVERQPQAVAGHGLVHGGVSGRERHPGRVREHLAALEVLEPRAADPHGRAHASPAARPRATVWRASLRLASSIISPSSSTAPLPSARSAPSSAATIALARSNSSGLRRERRVDRGELVGVHRPLAVEAERARLLRPRAQAVRVADRQVGPVDRLQPGSAGGHEHGLLRVQPQLRPRPSRAAGRARRRGRRSRGSAHRGEATPPRSRPPAAARPRSPPGLGRARARPLARASRAARPASHVLRPLDLGHDERPDPLPGAAGELGSRRRANHALSTRSRAAPPPRRRVHRASSRSATRLARLPFAAGGHGVLEVHHDLVGTQARRPSPACARTIRAPTGRSAGLA